MTQIQRLLLVLLLSRCILDKYELRKPFNWLYVKAVALALLSISGSCRSSEIPNLFLENGTICDNVNLDIYKELGHNMQTNGTVDGNRSS